MIAAGYNAGPSRPATWMVQRGDPRRGEVDVIDWIEHIPFTETRNYVMRVTESIPVYHARLTGETGPIDFTNLLIGRPPFVRPQARPDPGEPALPVSISQSLPVVAPGTSLRPLARPGG
jgi:soluble lytic murein transglycosylase